MSVGNTVVCFQTDAANSAGDRVVLVIVYDANGIPADAYLT